MRSNYVGGGLLLALAFGFAAQRTTNAQERKPLQVEDAVKTHSFTETSPLALSPDGRWVAYTVRDNSRSKEKAGTDEEIRVRRGVRSGELGGEIWITNTETGRTRNLTEKKGTNWHPTWSPNGRLLAFLSDRGSDGQARLCLWDEEKDELKTLPRPMVRTDYLSNGMQWTPDSQAILITTLPEGMSAEEYGHRALAPSTPGGEPKETESGSTVVVYEAGSGKSLNRVGPDPAMFSLDASYRRDLAVVDVASGKTKTIVHGKRIGSYALSPDGSQAAYMIPKRFEKPGSWQEVSDLFIVSLTTGEERVSVADARFDRGLSWSPDGSVIAYRACSETQDRCDFYVVQRTGGTPRKVSDLPQQIFNGWPKSPVWDASGKYFYLILDGALWRDSPSEGVAAKLAEIPDREIRYDITDSSGRLWTYEGGNATVVVVHDPDGKQDGFYRIDLLSGESSRLREKGECYSCKWPAPIQGQFLMAGSRHGERLVYVAEDAGHAPDLWASDPTFRDPRRLTHLNPQFDRYALGQPRLVEWLSADREQLRGALLLPPDYEPGHRYPLVVWVYLGARLSDRFDEFGFGEYPGPLNFQLLATRGYAVLLPDSEKALGEPGRGIAASVLPGVNKLVEMGIADANRIGVMGHSLGGYSTLALLVQTKRFRAAIDADSFSDFGAFYGMIRKDGSGFEYSVAERLLQKQPWQDPVKYIENSPFYSLDRVGTPLLIVHGSEDEAASVYLAGQLFAGLRRLNKTVEYREYMGEGHVPRDWSPANQLDLADRVLAWMDRYLKAPDR